MSNLTLVSDNKQPQIALPAGTYTPSSCRKMFSEGYKVCDNADVRSLYSSSLIILNDGSILYDWDFEYDDDDHAYVVSDGLTYDDTEIVYEIDEFDLKWATSKAPKLEVLKGQADQETPGMRRIRKNMKAWTTRSKKLYDERQSRNKNVK